MRTALWRIGSLATVGMALAAGPAGAVPGALTHLQTRTGDPGIAGARGVVVSPDGRHVYVAGRTAGAVVAYARAADGQLTPLGCVKDPGAGATCGAQAEGLGSVTYLAISADGKHVYGAGGGADNAVVTLVRDADTGLLSDGGCWADDGGGANCGTSEAPALSGAEGVAVSPDGKHVYVGAQGESALSTFTRDGGTGALTYVSCISDGTAGCTQTPANAFKFPREVTMAPDGRGVYVAAANSGVAAFLRDTVTGALTHAGTTLDLAPALVVGVVVSPDDRFVYTGARNRSAAYALQRDPATAALTVLGCVKTAASGATCGDEAPGLEATEAVAVPADGATLYAGGASALTVLHRTPATGLLTGAGCFRDLPGVPLGCTTQVNGLGQTRALAVSPDDRSVYAAAESDGAVAVFAREPAPSPPPAPPAGPAVPVAPTPPPAGPAAPAAVRFASVATLPSAKRCISRRSFRIRLRHPAGARIASAAVTVNGRRVATRRGTRITAPVNLKGLPKGKVRVVITVQLTDGRTVKGGRTYRTCAAKRRDSGSSTGVGKR